MRFLFVVIICHIYFTSVGLTIAKADSTSETAISKVHSYFESKQLNLDSAETEYLYYKIFDWIGTKYKYSGETKKGIDCSGFVTMLYENIYCMALSGGSKDIYKRTVPVDKNSIKEGDLVFFKIRKGQISHVGIYLQNNKFAHATVHGGVMISDLNEPYYKKYFFSCGRIN
ncbi:MAG: C40 family peptidase [Bacteroidetes bacterium]|nr:C40 family peptidase [Bacteroidota bacterium]